MPDHSPQESFSMHFCKIPPLVPSFVLHISSLAPSDTCQTLTFAGPLYASGLRHGEPGISFILPEGCVVYYYCWLHFMEGKTKGWGTQRFA